MLVHHWDFPTSTVRSFLRSILNMPFETTFRVYHTSFDDRVDTAVLVTTSRVPPGASDMYHAMVALRDAAQAEIDRWETTGRGL